MMRGVADYTCQAGAAELKARIESYWRERGFEVSVTLAPAPFTPEVRAARFDIRSNLVNGRPVALQQARAP